VLASSIFEIMAYLRAAFIFAALQTSVRQFIFSA